MKVLAVFDEKNYTEDMPECERYCVRGVIVREGKIAMQKGSSGEYKILGGGMEPDEDIAIKYTGLRAGEKLYEEKLMAEEGIQKTPNNMIYIGKPVPFDISDFLEKLKILEQMSYENSREVKPFMEEIVPTYHPL